MWFDLPILTCYWKYPYVVNNKYKSDIDYRRWSKRCLTLVGPTLKKVLKAGGKTQQLRVNQTNDKLLLTQVGGKIRFLFNPFITYL